MYLRSDNFFIMIFIYFLLYFNIYKLTNKANKILEKIRVLDTDLNELFSSEDDKKKLSDLTEDETEKIAISKEISSLEMEINKKKTKIVKYIKKLQEYYSADIRIT